MRGIFSCKFRTSDGTETETIGTEAKANQVHIS